MLHWSTPWTMPSVFFTVPAASFVVGERLPRPRTASVVVVFFFPRTCVGERSAALNARMFAVVNARTGTSPATAMRRSRAFCHSSHVFGVLGESAFQRSHRIDRGGLSC